MKSPFTITRVGMRAKIDMSEIKVTPGLDSLIVSWIESWRAIHSWPPMPGEQLTKAEAWLNECWNNYLNADVIFEDGGAWHIKDGVV